MQPSSKTIQDAVFDFIKSTTGLSDSKIIYQDQSTTAPNEPYVTLKYIQWLTSIGSLHKLNPLRLSESMLFKRCLDSIFRVDIQLFGDDAFDLVNKITMASADENKCTDLSSKQVETLQITDLVIGQDYSISIDGEVISYTAISTIEDVINNLVSLANSETLSYVSITATKLSADSFSISSKLGQLFIFDKSEYIDVLSSSEGYYIAINNCSDITNLTGFFETDATTRLVLQLNLSTMMIDTVDNDSIEAVEITGNDKTFIIRSL